MLQNIIAVIFTVVLIVELFICTAASNHRKKKKLKEWNLAKGKIKKIEKVQDELTHRNFMELTIISDDGHTVYSKHSPMFCIYEKGEEVELIEKDGVHKFIGNDRVNSRAKKEFLLGTLPMLVLVAIAALLSILTHIWT